MTNANDHLFWITSRAAGSTALLLASAGVAAGLLMGTKLVRGKRAGDLQALHEILSLATLVSIAVHGLSLLGDAFLHPSVADVLVPFVSGYHRIWTTAGIFAGWGLMALGLSYYARKRIGPAAGARRIASPRWPGSWASPTPSARAPTPGPRGSWSSWASPSSRPPSCSSPASPACAAASPIAARPCRPGA